MKKLIICLILAFPIFGLQAQNCNCGENFSFMVQRIQKNYVGYADKVNPKTKKRFEHLTDSLQKVARSVGSNKCIAVCREWLNFFKDGHMNISFNESSPKEGILDFFSKEVKTSWDEEKLKNYLVTHNGQTDSIEGIWTNLTNTTKLGIVRDSLNHDEFTGFMVKYSTAMWVPQQIKFKAKKTNGVYTFTSFLARDHSPYPARVSLDKDTMDLKEIGKFYKKELPQKSQNKLSNPRFEKLDNNTCLLTIPSFFS